MVVAVLRDDGCELEGMARWAGERRVGVLRESDEAPAQAMCEGML